jgi:molybdate transport system substrate-binding protein
MVHMRFTQSAVIAALLALPLCSSRSVLAGETIRVAAAISLKEALTDVGVVYERRTGDKVDFSFGASGQLMAQVKGGAPVDAFISAADKQVKDLMAAGLVDEQSRRVVVGNALVLIVPRDSKVSLDSFESLATASIKRLALGEPKTVPAGEYASQALEKLKLTEGLSDKLVYGSNVRQVLDYVIRGEVTAGIVYATDAKQAGDKVKVVATAPEESHDPIVYPAVVVKKSSKPDAAKRFLDYVSKDDEARRLLESRGFTRPKVATPANAPVAPTAPAANPAAERRP